MLRKSISISSILLLCILMIACGKRKDKKDTLKVNVRFGDQMPLPLGSLVKVYKSQKLFFEGVTNIANENGSGGSVLFTLEDHLFDEDVDRIEDIGPIIITHDDSLSINLSSLDIQLDFDEKREDNLEITGILGYSYYGLLENSNWRLVRGVVDGTEGTLASCVADNTLEFTSVLGVNPSFTPIYDEIIYKEGTDVCPDSDVESKINFLDQSFGVNGPYDINGTMVNNQIFVNGDINSGGLTLSVNTAHLIGLDTLVLRGKELSLNIDVDYYFVK